MWKEMLGMNSQIHWIKIPNQATTKIKHRGQSSWLFLFTINPKNKNLSSQADERPNSYVTPSPSPSLLFFDKEETYSRDWPNSSTNISAEYKTTTTQFRPHPAVLQNRSNLLCSFQPPETTGN